MEADGSVGNLVAGGYILYKFEKKTVSRKRGGEGGAGVGGVLL